MEALSEEFLAFVSIKGGAKTYVTNGVNGFLVDATNETTLRKDMEHVLYHVEMHLSDCAKIQRAGKHTVLNQLSIEEIAKRF